MDFSFFAKRSIRTRLTLSTLVVFVLSLWALSFFVSRMLRDDMTRVLGAQQFSAASLVAKNIDQELRERMNALQQVSTRVDASLIARPGKLQKRLEERLVIRQFFNGGFYVANNEGTAIASVPFSANRVGLNYMYRNHVAAALKEGKSSVSDVVIGKALNVPVFSLAVPIRDPRGAIIGAMVGVVNLDQSNFLDNIITNPYGKSGGYLLVARQQRLLVTATDKSRIMETLPPPGTNPNIDRFIDGDEGSTVLLNPHGLEVLVSAKAITTAGWYVAALLPTEEAFAPLRDMQQRMRLATLVLTLLAGGLTWWMVRHQLAPVLVASETLSSWSASDLSASVLPISHADEIGELVGGFNRLLQSLGERKEALKQSKARLASITEMTSDLVFACQRSADGLFRIDWIGGDAERVFGLDNASLIKLGCWRSFVIEADLPVFASAITNLQPGRSSSEVIRVTHADGSLRWVKIVARVEDDPDNSGRHRLLGALSDVTEHKLSEERLRQSEARTTSILEGAADAIFIADPQGRYLYVNREAARMLGYEREQLMAMTIRDITPAEDWQGVQQLFETELSSGHLRGEFWLKRSDGTTVPVEINGVVLPDGSVLGACRDISERKRTETELELHRHHLEELVIARTAEVAAARDEAEAANRAKSTFLANMSHELRTPMTAIMGMVDLVLRKSTEPKQIDQLTKAKVASQQLLAIINNILDISKIEAERLTLERIHFKVAETLENLISVIGHKAHDKGLTLRVDLPPEIAGTAFLGDPLRLGQILLNYASNAVKFTEHGEITVRARMLEDKPTDALLRWEVTDSGIGISPDDQQRLFTSFEQVDGSMTRKYGGTGLGLAISKRLAKLMGGDVGVSSAVGQGSTFWFTVRLEKDHHAVPPAPTFASDTAEAQIKAGFAGARILLAEDEPVNREVSLGMLLEVDLRVDMAEDGVIALAMARQHRYALILMDMQMPNLNGVDATRAIRSDSLNTDTPILAMTANAFDEDRQICIDAGMNDHIAKPVNHEVLFETLLKWLRSSPVTISGTGP